jgi:hypothetical protein
MTQSAPSIPVTTRTNVAQALAAAATLYLAHEAVENWTDPQDAELQKKVLERAYVICPTLKEVVDYMREQMPLLEQVRKDIEGMADS